MDEVMGVAEVAEYVGLKPGTISVYIKNGHLPPPDFETARQKLWLPATIDEWASEWRVGRFRKTRP